MIHSRIHPMINSVERDVRITKGEVKEVREMPGWERIRIQIDLGAMDTVGPKEMAKGFEMKEAAMSKRGIGFVRASGSGIENYGEKKIIRYAKAGEGVSLRSQART